MADKSQINEVVHLLSVYRPNALEQLKKEFPEESTRLLVTGVEAGEDTPSAPAGLVKLKAAIEGLSLVNDLCDEYTKRIRQNLINSRRVQIGGKIAAAVLSTSLIGMLLADVPKEAKIATAALTLAVGIAPDLANYMSTSLSSVGLFDLYSQLLTKQIDAQELLDRLKVERDSGAGSVSDEMINASNKVSREIKQIIAKV